MRFSIRLTERFENELQAKLNYWYSRELLMLMSAPSHRANTKWIRGKRGSMKITFPQTFVLAEQLTEGVLDGGCLLLSLQRRVLLPFSGCIPPPGVAVSLLVVCCWAQHFAKSKTMSCLGGLRVCLCPLVRLLHYSIKFPSYCTRLDAGLITQSLVSNTLFPRETLLRGRFHIFLLLSHIRLHFQTQFKPRRSDRTLK